MCYLVAKRFDTSGCLCWKTEFGEPLAELVENLNKVSEGKGMQVVIISSPKSYGEYRPYVYVDKKEDFVEGFHALMNVQ